MKLDDSTFKLLLAGFFIKGTYLGMDWFRQPGVKGCLEVLGFEP